MTRRARMVQVCRHDLRHANETETTKKKRKKKKKKERVDFNYKVEMRTQNTLLLFFFSSL